jgi:signal transduction histidine kinase
VVGNQAPSDNVLAEAWRLEFASQQFAEAAQLYDRFTADNDQHLAFAALAGKSRCLAKLGRLDGAIAESQKAAFAALPAHADPALRLAVVNARLLLLSQLRQSAPSPARSEILQRTVKALNGDLYHAAGDHAWLPANQNLFIAKKVLAALPGAAEESAVRSSAFTRPGPPDLSSVAASRRMEGGTPNHQPRRAGGMRMDELEKLAAAEELSIAAAETLGPSAGQFDGVFQTDLGGTPAYGLRHRTPTATLLALFTPAGIASALTGYQETFAGSESAYRIVSAKGDFVAGTPEPKDKPFATAALPECFPGWKVELYFEGGDVFERAARRQIAVYVWTGALVILLILIAGGFAMQAVGKQIRLNTMKNDFIATVSHELKTPLASMRVLVDTLLEGHVRDEAQAREYLRLTAKENERLSRMIDNFLTFSRMERNKNAFTLADARPAAIAQDAIESVKTKYATHNCQFKFEIAESVPEIHADHDAIVTVLVNLLDNACKYTTDDKQISLNVYPEPGCVCFAVADNGIGLARRHLRKIFDSFYQVDNSLARKVEGCGLGLSIVKFIVDAHRGKVIVESKPGRGSKFTVRLPVGRRNGD